MNHSIKENPSGFEYDYYTTAITDDFSSILSHWHPELEIIYVHKGSARYHIRDTTFSSQAGDIILIQPTSIHSIFPIEKEEQYSETFSIHLDHLGRSNVDKYSQRYIQPIHNHHFELTTRITSHMPGYQSLKECLLAIFTLVKQQDIYFDMLLKSKLHEFLYLLFKFRHINRHYTDDTYQKYQKLKDLIEYIYHHSHEQLSVSLLAHRFGYSRTHFMAVFKQHTGSSCLKFILHIRLNKACDLLVQTNLPIKTIAEQVGFHNLANFNRKFKQQYQLTPHSYRKQMRQGDSYFSK